MAHIALVAPITSGRKKVAIVKAATVASVLHTDAVDGEPPSVPDGVLLATMAQEAFGNEPDVVDHEVRQTATARSREVQAAAANQNSILHVTVSQAFPILPNEYVW